MMPSKKKKFNSRFPPARIKKIMQSDEEVGKVAQVVPIIVSNALESFVKQLLTQSLAVTKSRNARTLTPTHIKCTILNNPEFAFLRDVANSIPDVNKEADDEEQESGIGSSSVVSTASTSAYPHTKNGASSSSGVPSCAGGPVVHHSKRGRPRKRPLEEDVLASAQPIDYAVRKPVVPMSQYQPSSSSAAALAAVMATTTTISTNNQSIIDRPGPSKHNSAESDDDTEGEEESGDEDEDDTDEDEEEVVVPQSGFKKVRINGPPSSTSSATFLRPPPAHSTLAAAEIDDDYDN